MNIRIELADFAARLSNAGLHTRIPPPPYDWLDVGLPWQPVPGEDCSGFATTVFGRTVHIRRFHQKDRKQWFVDPGTVYRYKGRWSFLAWGIPYIGSSYVQGQIQRFRDSLEEMFELVWDYYFREPVLIEGWRFPLYQRPDWKREEVESAISRARVKTRDEISAILHAAAEQMESRPEREVRDRSAERRYGGLILEILPTMDDLLYDRIDDPDPLDPTRRLYIRYDCKEAFIDPDPWVLSRALRDI